MNPRPNRLYVSGIVHLIEHKEVALIEAVETGRLPISIAVQIANGKDGEVPEALSDAYETRQLRGTKLAAARRLIAKRIEKRQKDGKAEEVRRKVTGNMLVQVYKQRVREGPAAASKKLQATSIAARSMLEEENEFLLRDLRSVEEPYGTDILTLTVACGYRDRLLKNTKIERYLARHHIDILHALQKLLSENGLKHTASGNGKS